MEKVKVKAKNKGYEGYMLGVKFTRGEAEVEPKVAEMMKDFGVTVEAKEPPEEPKPKKAKKAKKGE